MQRGSLPTRSVGTGEGRRFWSSLAAVPADLTATELLVTSAAGKPAGVTFSKLLATYLDRRPGADASPSAATFSAGCRLRFLIAENWYEPASDKVLVAIPTDRATHFSSAWQTPHDARYVPLFWVLAACFYDRCFDVDANREGTGVLRGHGSRCGCGHLSIAFPLKAGYCQLPVFSGKHEVGVCGQLEKLLVVPRLSMAANDVPERLLSHEFDVLKRLGNPVSLKLLVAYPVWRDGVRTIRVCTCKPGYSWLAWCQRRRACSR